MDIEEFITDKIKQGLTKDEIKNLLVASGWNDQAIQNGFEAVFKEIPKPKLSISETTPTQIVNDNKTDQEIEQNTRPDWWSLISVTILLASLIFYIFANVKVTINTATYLYRGDYQTALKNFKYKDVLKQNGAIFEQQEISKLIDNSYNLGLEIKNVDAHIAWLERASVNPIQELQQLNKESNNSTTTRLILAVVEYHKPSEEFIKLAIPYKIEALIEYKKLLSLIAANQDKFTYKDDTIVIDNDLFDLYNDLEKNYLQTQKFSNQKINELLNKYYLD